MKKLILSLSTLAILAMSFGCTNPTSSNPTAGNGNIFSGEITFTKQQFMTYLDCVANAIPATDADAQSLKSVIMLSKTQLALIPDAQWNASAKTTVAAFESFKTVMTNLNCKI